ncbi:MAG: cyclic nucleotide-binding domain-containing protein [Anaerolineales bacterium]|nr:cyclic nucleotide-binding domain-containing protein [Anaerolineales bacterium]
MTVTAASGVDKLALLAGTFGGLASDELTELAGLTKVGRYPAGHVLCQEDAHEDIFYILASGEAVITKQISDAEGERVLRRVGVGDYVGEMALIQNAPRAATVRTVSECTVLEIGKQDFEAMLSRSPRLAISIIRTTLSRMRVNDQMAIGDLQRTNRVLAQLDRNKLEFIQVAAHELRTPLTVMKGYLNVIKSDERLPAGGLLAEALAGLSRGTERLQEVVNAMLDVARIDADMAAGPRFAVVPVPLKSMVNDLVRRLESDAEGRQLRIDIEHARDTPALNADPTLIQKALYQVLINAIKYTPDGGRILVRTRPVQLDRGVPGAEISVRDTGIGLAPEHQELIFEKFYQVGSVDLHSSHKTMFRGGGPGLGLAIARGAVRAHGGRIWVESLGHDEANCPGSTFYLHLPVDPPHVRA